MSESWDYIIVGAGSSGCVLADRLSADGRYSVLMLEAGGTDDSPMIHMPKGIGKVAANPRYAWHYQVDQRRLPDVPSTESWVRGKGLGGSSSINGMIYVRGQPEDYEQWVRRGATGWGWDKMKRAYQAIEDHELGAGDGRGVGGPLHISTGKYRYPLAEAMIRAGEQMGLRRKDDLNGEDQEGIGYYSHNIKDGRRQSAALIFLKPASRRPNVKVVTGAQVDRIRFDGRRAVGVDAVVHGQPTFFAAAGEVILSTGAVVSPLILQRSGVGAAQRLASLGIDIVADSPAVGHRLLEHLGISLPHRLRGAKGNNREFQGLRLVGNVLRYYLKHDGPMATGPYEVGAFVRSHADASRPDLQLFWSAFTFKRVTNANAPVQLAAVEDEPGMTLYGQLVGLTSEGSVEISSADPAAPPIINPNWLTTPEDVKTGIASIRYMRRILQQGAIAPYVGEELLPGRAFETDAEIDKALRLYGRCGTHAVGTCAMGGSNDSVLDADLRVRGVEGLRVVDCSAMPGLISGNTNGPAMALGWRAGEVIQRSRRST
ncbi:GMC family oxidoreductase [Sphingobium sp.]|uniref:GMC family oxidoreductase n=1 Tax=Sphingobium sp. TaxID=1912891 RepID=UPI002CF6EA95|nr:GMC family oxidoreductase N-terminal domain-containing protein [Sphingobium sp.]HUD91086.1 GMC family oxidoreductase N-terminal domain-containing protein [Sphingobium sp.]